MKILNKKGTQDSSASSEFTPEEMIAFLSAVGFAILFVLFLSTVGHWLYEDYLSNQVEFFVPTN